jgi:hypothetical protein
MKETYNNENLHDELTIKIKEFIENMEEFKTTPFIKTDKKCLKGFGIEADNGHDNVMKRFTIVVEDHKHEINLNIAPIGTKSLHNTDTNSAKKNVNDIVFWGDGDTFKLISKASSESEGWMKSTKGMQAGRSVVIQVTTQQRNLDGTYSVAEALTTIDNAKIVDFIENGKVIARHIQHDIY